MLNKVDELSLVLNHSKSSIAAITETWLSSDVPDCACAISGYNLYRKDRATGPGGGVALYVDSDYCTRRTSELEVDDFEVLWVTIRPKLLPRPLSVLVVAVILPTMV